MKKNTLFLLLVTSLLSSCTNLNTLDKNEAVARANDIINYRNNTSFPGNNGWKYEEESVIKSSSISEGRKEENNSKQKIKCIIDVENEYYYAFTESITTTDYYKLEVYIYGTEDKYVIAVDKTSDNKTVKWYQNIFKFDTDFSNVFTYLEENLPSSDDVLTYLYSNDLLNDIESLYEEYSSDDEELGIYRFISVKSANDQSLIINYRSDTRTDNNIISQQSYYKFEDCYLREMKCIINETYGSGVEKTETSYQKKVNISFKIGKNKYPNLDEFTKKVYVG